MGATTKNQHRITKRVIDSYVYDGDGRRPVRHTDADLPGFSVRVMPSGRKQFYLRYRVSGRRREVCLGSYPDLTVDQARKKAIALRGEVASGKDPLAEKERCAARGSVAELAEYYLEQCSKPHKKTWKTDQSRIENYINPTLGRLAANAVRRADVEALHNSIGRNASKPYEANRVLALLRVMFNKGRIWGHVPEEYPNPCSGVQKFPESKRTRFLQPHELPALAKAILHEQSPYIRAAIWLYLLTGARKNELLRLRWDDIDWERRQMTLRETKGGRDQVVPLSLPALETLRQIPPLLHNVFVFASTRSASGHLVNIDKPWRRIRSQAALEDLTLHDLRRTVGSWAVSSGQSLKVVSAMLGHSTARVTEEHYAHLMEHPAREAFERLGEQLTLGTPITSAK